MTELTIKVLHFPQSYLNGVTHFPAFGEKKTLENRNLIMGRLVVLLFRYIIISSQYKMTCKRCYKVDAQTGID